MVLQRRYPKGRQDPGISATASLLSAINVPESFQLVEEETDSQDQGSCSEDVKRSGSLPEAGGAVVASPQFSANTKSDRKLPTKALVRPKVKPLLPSQINTKIGCAREPF